MRQQQVDLKALHAFAQALDKNTFLLPGKQANAFTAGLLRPRCYLTTGLRDALSNEELEIVLQHERVHARHHDPLLKWLFALASSVYPQLVATQLQQQMTLAMEQHADEAVASKRFGKSDVALTLVKVQRLAAAGLQRANEQFCYFTGDALEQRVHYLMQREMVTGFPLRAVLFLAPLAFLLSSAFTDSLHHAIELLLSF
jgi:beta-lactamase regulating signal transducer with metallopeptidase domain